MKELWLSVKNPASASSQTTTKRRIGQEGAKLILWQKSGRRNSSYEAEIILELKEEEFNKPIFSPSEKYVLFEDGSILCLDTRTIFKLGKNSEEARDSWSLHHSQPYAVWHPNEDIVALIATKRFKEDNLICRIEIWDIAQNKILSSHFTNTEESISCMDWSPDGSMIAFSSADFTVTIWNLCTNETHTSFIEEARVCDLYFSPDGQRLSVQTVKNQQREKAYIVASNDAEIPISFSGDITIFSESPWHRKGRHIGYQHDGTIQVRKLKFEP